MSWPLAFQLFMPLTGNVINELIICLISHQGLLCVCVQYVYDPDMMETILMPKYNQCLTEIKIEINTHDPASREEKKKERKCGFFWTAVSVGQ